MNFLNILTESILSVSIVCSGKHIAFIEKEQVKFSLEVKYIFKL